VAISTMNAQNVKKWAAPGIDHFNSLRCPKTSTSWAFTRSPMPSNRPGAACPDRISRNRNSTRRPATAMATKVIATPRTRRTSTISSIAARDVTLLLHKWRQSRARPTIPMASVPTAPGA
jgi:hypothetical protein